MLIASKRHTADDLALWEELQGTDRMLANRKLHQMASQAAVVIRRFAESGGCYAGVSWGKDSVVLAHLIVASQVDVPLAWVKQRPLYNPDCELVRDAFCKRFPSVRYDEIEVAMTRGKTTWHATGSLESGFAKARERHGGRHLSGIRSQEAGGRAIRQAVFGTTSNNTCAPLTYWKHKHIFAYLAMYDLPVHPVYAMLGGGRWDRDKVRVCSLGGQRGAGIGRAEWEDEYYGDVLARLKHER